MSSTIPAQLRYIEDGVEKILDLPSTQSGLLNITGALFQLYARLYPNQVK